MLKVLRLTPEGAEDITDGSPDFDADQIRDIKTEAISAKLISCITEFLVDAFQHEGIGITALVAIRPSIPCRDCDKIHISSLNAVHGEPVDRIPPELRLDTDEKVLAYLADIECQIMGGGKH